MSVDIEKNKTLSPISGHSADLAESYGSSGPREAWELKRGLPSGDWWCRGRDLRRLPGRGDI